MIDYLIIQLYNQWKRNVWYKGMTDEEIQEHEIRVEIQMEWEQTPDGQQYLKVQEEIGREILEVDSCIASTSG